MKISKYIETGLTDYLGYTPKEWEFMADPYVEASYAVRVFSKKGDIDFIMHIVDTAVEVTEVVFKSWPPKVKVN
jgi:hypothetical protein